MFDVRQPSSIAKRGEAALTTWTIRRERFNPPHPYKADLNTIDELRNWLTQLGLEKDSSFILTNEKTGDQLFVGMDYPFAVVSFVRGSDHVPTSASADPSFEAASEADYHELDIWGEPTPIPKDRCLSFELMTRVVEHIFVEGALPDWIAWRTP